jgi:hypothetical protein
MQDLQGLHKLFFTTMFLTLNNGAEQGKINLIEMKSPHPVFIGSGLEMESRAELSDEKQNLAFRKKHVTIWKNDVLI